MQEHDLAHHYRPGLNPDFVNRVKERKAAERKEREVAILKAKLAEAERQRKELEAKIAQEKLLREQAIENEKKVIENYQVIVVHGVSRSSRDIIRETAKACRVSAEEMLGRSGQKKIVDARHLAMYRLRNERGLSLPKIGQIFGRDHSTVIHAIRKVEAKRKGVNGQCASDLIARTA